MAEIDVRVGVNYSSKPLRTAEKDMRRLGASGNFARAKLAALTLAFGALGRASLKAAADDARSQAVLANTLKNLGWENQTAAVAAYIDELQMATGVVDDQLRPAFASLVRVLDDVQGSQALLNLSLDIAAGTGKDVQSVVNTLTKAIQGQRKGLITLGSGLDAATLKTASMAEIVQILTDRYQGAAGAAADSYAGKYDRMKIAMSEAAETLGTSFFDALSQSNVNVTELGKAINSFAGAIGTVVGKIGSFFTTTVNGWQNVKRYFLNDPVFAGLLRLFGVQTGPRATGASTIADYKMGRQKSPEQQQNEQLLKLLKQIEAANKKRAAAESARSRAAEAQARRQKQLDKELAQTEMKYDTERAGLMKALAEAGSQDTKKRLTDLLALNTATYAQALGLTTTEQILELINAQMDKWFGKQKSLTAATEETTNAYAKMLSTMNQQAAAAGAGRDFYYSATGTTAEALASISNAQAADILTNYFPELDRGAANPGAYGGTNVTVNVNGTTIGNDIDQVILDAVNRATRGGGLLRGGTQVL